MRGTTPVLSKVVKVLAHATGRTLQLTDHDGVMQYLAMEHGRHSAKLRLAGDRYNGKPEGQKGSSPDPSPRPPHFHYLVTRPTVLVKDGPASKRLCASKSVSSPHGCLWCRTCKVLITHHHRFQQPGPFSISTGDLAEFTLNALLDVKLYDSCPYVVSANGL
jgi:hypothetical protein